MGWLAKLFGHRDESPRTRSDSKLPSFPIWLEQQGSISVQDGLDRYIDQFMSLEPVDLTSPQPTTIEERTRDVSMQRAEVALLEQCCTYYGEDSMSPEFKELLATKKLGLQMAEDSLEMKLKGQRIIQEATERAASSQRSSGNS